MTRAEEPMSRRKRVLLTIVLAPLLLAAWIGFMALVVFAFIFLEYTLPAAVVIAFVVLTWSFTPRIAALLLEKKDA